MKNMIFSALLSFLLLGSAAGVRAEDLSGLRSDLGSTSSRPEIADDAEIAMKYWLLARKEPKFEDMARKTKKYQEASQFERDGILSGQVAMMKNTYNSVSFSRPTVVGMKVRLSAYSPKNDGFAITDFEEETYFMYTFAGENYAIVPRGLMDHQFLGPIQDQQRASKIAHMGGNFHVFDLMVYVKLDYADPPDTMTEIGGKRYHIISGQVAHVALYGANETEQLWGDNSDEFNSTQHNELMNLKQ
ncbi:MAG: hypothetical protein EPN97_15250 [Alphaproteobacteria bacterium]|nr:MAG: hypothetical protein EPN97_15250 [Alphaproteobacteria bacterium]